MTEAIAPPAIQSSLHPSGSFGSMTARTLLHPSVATVISSSVLGLAIALHPLSALAQERTVWRGSGQVVSGHGQGASVHLVVETTPDRIRTQSGPALDASFSGGQQTVSNEAGTWQIESRGDRLGVTLYRENQTIRYQLSPSQQKNQTEKSAIYPQLASQVEK
ncbi:MAG: hypothetical protein AAFY57_13945 [Cyanobacteria bacterium J06642_2]